MRNHPEYQNGKMRHGPARGQGSLAGDPGQAVLDFGKNRGVALGKCPVEYLHWLAGQGRYPEWASLARRHLKRRERRAEPLRPKPTAEVDEDAWDFDW
jgi:hypothetical protein